MALSKQDVVDIATTVSSKISEATGNKVLEVARAGIIRDVDAKIVAARKEMAELITSTNDSAVLAVMQEIRAVRASITSLAAQCGTNPNTTPQQPAEQDTQPQPVAVGQQQGLSWITTSSASPVSQGSSQLQSNSTGVIGETFIGSWGNPGEAWKWTVPDLEPGVYKVVFRYQCAAPDATRIVSTSGFSRQITFPRTAPDDSWYNGSWSELSTQIVFDGTDNTITVSIPDSSRPWTNFVDLNCVAEPVWVEPSSSEAPQPGVVAPQPVPYSNIKTARSNSELASILSDATPGLVVNLEGMFDRVDISNCHGTLGSPVTIRGGNVAVSGWQGVLIANSSFIKLSDIKIVGDNHNIANGVEIRNSHNVEVEKCSVSNVGGGGISAVHSDSVYIHDNTIVNTSALNTYATSGISFYQCVQLETAARYGGFNNAVVRNKVFNAMQTVGPHTDGNGFIWDDMNHSQTSFSPTPNNKYVGSCLVAYNLFVGCGGRGIHSFYSDNLTAVFNTVGLNQQDQELGDCGELSMPSSNNTRFEANLIMPKVDKKIWLEDGGSWGASGTGNTVSNNVILGQYQPGVGGNTFMAQYSGFIIKPTSDPVTSDWRTKIPKLISIPETWSTFLKTDLEGNSLGATVQVGAYSKVVLV